MRPLRRLPIVSGKARAGGRPRRSAVPAGRAAGTLLLALAAVLVLIPAESLRAAAPPAPQSALFPPVKLRGYGTLSGTCTVVESAGQPAAALRIACQDSGKAKLVLAKYLADLELLPGVERAGELAIRAGQPDLAVHAVQRQGFIVAARSGAAVWILAAPTRAALAKLAQGNLAAGSAPLASAPEVRVPMYLDRWDKHAFRFYYGPFVKPQDAGHRDVAVYDPRRDFVFAKQSGDAGLVVWNAPFAAPTADGILDFNSRAWVFQAAQRLTLPVGVNLGLEANNPSLANRDPGDMVPNAPQYVGGWYGAINFGCGSTVAWSADAVQDVALGQLQPLVRRLGGEDTVVNWLEPHEEMCHGVCDVLDDHGPNARLSFQRFLATRYRTPEALAVRWRQPGAFRAWADVPFPELATFLGWNATAIDLAGTWKISYDAPRDARSARAGLDDSAWANLPAPGHTIVRALPRQPAVFRRHVWIDPAWRTAHLRVWLYLFDLNDTRGETPAGLVQLFVNGRAIPENPPFRAESHWAMPEVSSALTGGDNLIALCLPQALLGYRVYLSGEAPRTYPALGEQLNATWADFSDWTAWSRGQAVRRGAQMIRQVDPDRPITLMSPDAYMGPIKEVAEDYGGIFHDTGGMAGSWGDMHPVMAQSMGLPSDCEPGSGAVDLDDFKRFMGRWLTEGTQGVDYFQHIGDILWKPAVRDHFRRTLPLWQLLGKYHVPQAELAVMLSDRDLRLCGFPWNSNEARPELVQRNRFWELICNLAADYPRGGVLEQDFARGRADRFRVILDGNTTIMEPELVEQIEHWVRRGGVFITYHQTGRHTPVTPDAWPIARLTGYAVTGIDKLSPNGDGLPSRPLHPAAGQKVFRSDAPQWRYVQRAAGLSLKKIDPACEDLLLWEDGSVAAGLRRLGKGLVFNLGANSSVLPFQVLEWLGVKKTPIAGSDKAVVTRHFVSNNGLYDVWLMWNSKGEPVTSTFTFRAGCRPALLRDANSGAAVPLDSEAGAVKLAGLAFGAWETRGFLSPRGRIAQAPCEWFALQRDWWSGTADPGPPVPPFRSKLCLDLTDDWAYKLLDGGVAADPAEDPALADPKLDDSSWRRMPIGIYNLPDHADAHHVVFRKSFRVPTGWDRGRVCLFTHADVLGRWRRYLDGKPLQVHKGPDDDLGGILTPGSTHCLAIEFWGPELPAGTRTPIFLSYHPNPAARQPLRAAWSYAADRLRYGPAAPLPLTIPSAGSIRTTVKIDPAQSARNILVHVEAGADAVIVNGQWLAGFSNIYRHVDLNATPWVRWGRDNELIVLFHEPTTIPDAWLEFYDQDVYP
jgi:hypothetical protein